MLKFTIREIKDIINARIVSGDPEYSITGVNIDSRAIQEGNLFIALKGDNFDGHDFIPQAISNGARAVIICNDLKEYQPGITYLKTADSYWALEELALNYRRKFDIPVISIVGSCGKTITKEMTAGILEKKFRVLKNPENENNAIGVSKVILNLNASHQALVLELGTNHFGEIKRLSAIARPTRVCFTNIACTHIEFLKDLDGVRDEKLSVLEEMGEDGFVAFNADDERLKSLEKSPFKKVTYGLREEADFSAREINCSNTGVDFLLNKKDEISIKMLGTHQVYNALAAIAITSQLGIKIDQVKEALSEISPMPMRGEVSKINEVEVIDETYNSNPYSVRRSLELFRDFKTSGRKIIALGDMLELGKESAQLHEKVGQLAGDLKPDLLVAVGNFSDHVLKGAASAGLRSDAMVKCATSNEAGDYLKNILHPNDTILIKGSRGIAMERIMERLK